MMHSIGGTVYSMWWCSECHVVQRGPSTGDFECSVCAANKQHIESLMGVSAALRKTLDNHLDLIKSLTTAVSDLADVFSGRRIS